MGISCLKLKDLGVGSMSSCIGGTHPDPVCLVLNKLWDFVWHTSPGIHHLEPIKKLWLKIWAVLNMFCFLRIAYWFREFSISRVYWHGSDNADKELDFVSPHFNLRELWLALTHSTLGGAGGRGRVWRRAVELKCPGPTQLTAWTRIE